MADYLEKNGRPMPRDNLFLGSAYRQAGIMAAYDPARVENAEDDDRGLGAWQDRKNWSIVSQLRAAMVPFGWSCLICPPPVRMSGKSDGSTG